MKPRLFFAMLLMTTLVMADPAQSAEPPQWTGQRGGDKKVAVQVYKTQASWAAFWTALNQPVPQALDEAREMAVWIAVGQRYSGGFKPRILGAIEKEGKLVVSYTDGKPSAGMAVTQNLTQPWVIAILPKSDLPVVPEQQGGL